MGIPPPMGTANGILIARCGYRAHGRTEKDVRDVYRQDATLRRLSSMPDRRCGYGAVYWVSLCSPLRKNACVVDNHRRIRLGLWKFVVSINSG